jgi:hypothetical protein
MRYYCIGISHFGSCDSGCILSLLSDFATIEEKGGINNLYFSVFFLYFTGLFVV